MDMNLSFLFVYYSIFLANAIFVLAAKNLLFKRWNQTFDWTFLVICLFLFQPLTLFYAFLPGILVVNLIIDILILFIAKRLFANYSYAGLFFYTANYLLTFIGIAWGASFIFSLHASLITKSLLVLFTPFLIMILPGDFIQLIEVYDVLCRQRWLRPRTANPVRTKNHSPMISIHVPVHAEPPEIVIDTLNTISKLDYENYEVIVVDNNTQHSSLWMPVKKHCEKLGNKFKFFHVDNLEGAKGGALNFALEQTDPTANLVSVVDADYNVAPDFLKSLIGYFDDPKIGFVQTPHDYREWKGNLYLTMCYWEYLIFFHTTLVSLNERDAALTVGTMCLIRKSALQKAGGWSEWCVTEDSELAIRIHDKGYSSVYVNKTYGKGLIPSTYAGYKKQRYRWTAGPIQEFQYHYKHLSGLSGKPSGLNFLQRLHHLNHGLDNLILGLGLPFTVLSIAEILSMVFHHEIIQVPFELWLAATVLLVANFGLNLLIYQKTLKPGFWQLIGGMLASKALQHIVSYSAFRTSITGSAAWKRTNKFKSKHTLSSALMSSREELIIGLFLIDFIVNAFIFLPHPGLSLMLLIGLFYIATNYLFAPIFSIINVLSMRHAGEDEFDIPYIPILDGFYPNVNDQFLSIN